jgi:hypothetical protein
VDLAHLPAYPADMRPRRMMSIALIPPTIMKGWDELEAYIARFPKEKLEHFSSRTALRMAEWQGQEQGHRTRRRSGRRPVKAVFDACVQAATMFSNPTGKIERPPPL